MGADENLIFLMQSNIFLIGLPALGTHGAHENLIFLNENYYFFIGWPALGAHGGSRKLDFPNENGYFSYWLASPRGPFSTEPANRASANLYTKFLLTFY